MSIILEGGRKEQTSEQHCLVLPQTDHEREPGPRHSHQQIYLPQINPGESHTDREQLFWGRPVQPDIFGGFYEHKK